MSAPSTPHEITVCRGVQAQTNCRFAMPVPESLAVQLEQCLAQSGWAQFLRGAVTGPVLHHHTFRVALAACPNGCSRPHVADVGIIRAISPELDPSLCSCCGLCARVCPDKAMTMHAHGPVCDHERCMRCGICVDKCPERALNARESGYRIVLGGKLGRHPRLATELPGVFDAEQAVTVVSGCVNLYMRHYRKGLRFGTLVEELGDSVQDALERA